MEKHKFASVSLTMQDTAILSKLSTHRISQQTILCNFQKKNPLPPKMEAILNFKIFAQNGKTQICFCLLNHARYSDFVETFYPQDISANYSLQFSKKKSSPPKNGGHFEFSNFCQKSKNTNLLLSP